MTTLLDRLAAHGVEIPTAVTDAVAMEKAAGQHIQRPIDAATILTDAYNRGELTPQNLEERLMAAAEREWFSTPRHGSPTWQLAKTIQQLTELTVASWYASRFDDIIAPIGTLFDKQAKIINEQAGKALPENATPEQVLAGGQKALDAKHQVALAEVAALELWALIQEVAQAASHPISFALVCDPHDGELPAVERQHMLAQLVREGVRLGINSPERVAEIEAAVNERARAAELAYWRTLITEDELRIDSYRQVGQTPAQGPVRVPEHFEFLRAEARNELGIKLASERFRNSDAA